MMIVEIFLGLVIAMSLVMCMIDTIDHITIAIFAAVLLLLLRHSEPVEPDDDRLTQEQAALRDAYEGMHRRKQRAGNRRLFFPQSDQAAIAASREEQEEFEELMSRGRNEQESWWN